jgi:hypothetical protein
MPFLTTHAVPAASLADPDKPELPAASLADTDEPEPRPAIAPKPILTTRGRPIQFRGRSQPVPTAQN